MASQSHHQLATQLAERAARPLTMKLAIAQLGQQERQQIEGLVTRLASRDPSPPARTSREYRLAKDIQRAAQQPAHLASQITTQESATIVALLGRQDAIERRIQQDRATSRTAAPPIEEDAPDDPPVGTPTRIDTPQAARAYVAQIPDDQKRRACPKPSQRQRPAA